MDLYPLTDEYKKLLVDMRALIDAQKGKDDDDAKLLRDPINEIQLEEQELVRYIKARKENVADAYQQLIETLRWRRDAYGGVDKTFAGDDPNEEFFQTNCPHVYRGFDKQGRPISYERTGVYHLPTLLAGVGEEGILRRRVHHQELMARKMKEKSKELGKHVTQQVWVLDARNISLKPTGDGPRLFRETIRVDSTYYPERLGYMFIINAPWIFKPLWAMVRPWLDQNTAAKIRVFGSSDYQEELQRFIDADQIPKEYGGTANFKLPGRPEDWSDVDDKDDENGYHELTLSRGSIKREKSNTIGSGGANSNNDKPTKK